MKNFSSAISSLLLLFSLILLSLTQPAFAASKVVGQVIKVSGHAFLMRQGHVVEMNRGTYLQDFDEVLTEDGAEVMLGDFSRRQVTMAGGGHLKWMNQVLELKRGYVWAQSQNPSDPFIVQTATGQNKILKGEMVVSFDQATGKSQVLALSGTVTTASLLTGASYDLQQGQFTMAEQEENDGEPRTPTNIGFDSLKKMRNLFSLVHPLGRMDDKTFLPMSDSSDRAPASTDGETTTAGQYQLPQAIRLDQLEKEKLQEKVVVKKEKHVEVKEIAKHEEQAAKHDDKHEVKKEEVAESKYTPEEDLSIHDPFQSKPVKEVETATAPVPAADVAPTLAEEAKKIVPGEIKVIKHEVLPEKKAEPFALDEAYKEAMIDVETHKRERLKHHKIVLPAPKVRFFGQAQAIKSQTSISPRSPASQGGVVPDKSFEAVKTQLRLTGERNALIDKLSTVTPAPQE